MKETMRDTAPVARKSGEYADPIVSGTGVDHHHHTSTTSTNAEPTSSYSASRGTEDSTLGGVGSVGSAGAGAAEGPAHGAGVGWNHSTSIGGHGSSHPEQSASVIDKLNRNVQDSVKETTGASDPHVADQQPKTGFGQRVLQGLGLGGDERKTTLRDV